jgi:hypothetical protein
LGRYLTGSSIADEVSHAISDVSAKEAHCARDLLHGNMTIIVCWNIITIRSATLTEIEKELRGHYSQ